MYGRMIDNIILQGVIYLDSGDAIQLGTIIVLLALSAFFSSAETAYTSINRIRLRTLIEEGNTAAKRVERIIHNPGKMLSAILIGNNIVNLSASSLMTIFSTNVFGSRSVGAATGVLTLLVKCGLAASKGEGRRLVQQGGISVNDEKVTDFATMFEKTTFTGDGAVIRKGKKVFHKAFAK